MTPPPSGPAPRGRLLQVLGTAFGVAVIVGNSIGVGIMRTPGDVAAWLPSAPWFFGVWIAGGIYALLGALTLAEPGAMIPRSGGMYVMARRGLGEYPGFAIGWTDTISTCASIAAITIAMGEYAGGLVPALQGHTSLTAVSVVTVLAAIQWRGIRAGDLVQQATSFLKVLVLVGLALVCLVVPAAHAPMTAAVAAPIALISFKSVVLALQAVIYTYDGWNGMIYFSGEVKNPGRDIPRSMVSGVLFVIAIYVLINIALLYVLPMSRMANDPFVAGTAATVVFGPRGDTVIRTIMIISALGAVSACQLMAPRVILAMSRDGLMPASVARVNRGGTPTVGTIASTAVALTFIATGTFERALALIAFFFVANYTLSFLSVFVLRRREPDLPRPYRVWGYPWTTGIAFVGSLLFLVGQCVGDTRNSLWSLALLAVSYPVYLLMSRGKGEGTDRRRE